MWFSIFMNEAWKYYHSFGMGKHIHYQGLPSRVSMEHFNRIFFFDCKLTYGTNFMTELFYQIAGKIWQKEILFFPGIKIDTE